MSDPTNDPQAVLPVAPIKALPAGSDSQPDQPFRATHASSVGLGPIVDPLLYIHVTTHGDIEQLRIASQHRLRILTTTEPDEDGVVRGFGLSERHPDVARVAGIVEALTAIEHDAELNLRRAFRGCAIHPWVKAQCGLGDKQVARLLGAIGDPYWHLAEDRPRTVSELWAYCGLHVLPASHMTFGTHHDTAGGVQLPASQSSHEAHVHHAGGTQLPADQCMFDTQPDHVGGNQTSDPGHYNFDAQRLDAGVAARRRKGQRSNWSTEAKTRAYLCATSCIKQDKSPYRAVYLARREHTAITHPEWTPGHSHNDALRIASKAILRDLWREARGLHGHTGQQKTAA